MKVKFLATGTAPTYYEISGETINGIDLSIIEHGGQFVGNDETKTAGIRNAQRDEHGELWVTLTQEVGPGHWTESAWFDADSYAPDTVYVVKLNKPHAGQAYAVTRKGKVYV